MKKIIGYSLFLIIACNSNKSQDMSYKKIGTIERIDPMLDAIVSPDAKAEIIAEGFEWSEGPLWVEKENMLLFSDVPMNIIYKWTEEKGKEIYLKPSGYTGTTPSKSKESGSNGLILDSDGNLVLCQHGDRRMARMEAPLNAPVPKFISIAENYNGKRFSSPNDAIYNSGELFFTDPPFGLPTQSDNDPTKETIINGVYRVTKEGEVNVVVDSLSRPNGLAFFPGGKKMLVANCDPAKPNWYVYDIDTDNKVSSSKLFFSLEGYDKKLKGLPDGLKIDKNGNVFATGPGGVYFFNKDGKLLGKLKLDNATSNIALSPDEKIIYITNDMYVLRLKMRK